MEVVELLLVADCLEGRLTLLELLELTEKYRTPQKDLRDRYIPVFEESDTEQSIGSVGQLYIRKITELDVSKLSRPFAKRVGQMGLFARLSPPQKGLEVSRVGVDAKWGLMEVFVIPAGSALSNSFENAARQKIYCPKCGSTNTTKSEFGQAFVEQGDYNEKRYEVEGDCDAYDCKDCGTSFYILK